MNNATHPKPGFLRTLLTVTAKEWRDFARDRRTFLMTLLVAPLIYPLIFLGMDMLVKKRSETQLEKTLALPVIGIEHAPNLVDFLASHGIEAREAPANIEARIIAQQEDLALRIDPSFGEDWRAGKPAKLEIVTDTTRRNSDIPVARLRKVLQAYDGSIASLRLLVRGINPAVASPLSIGTHDLASEQAKRASFMTVLLPLILTIFAFIGGAHLAMDTTAGERERQSLEPLLATPASRGALVGGKMLAAMLLGLCSMLLILLSFKLTATFAGGIGKQMDVSFVAMAKLMLTLVPLVLIGTALITSLAAGAKSMKEAQSHILWLMLMPMLPAYALMAYPIKDTALWQYAVPFLSQNQLIQKITRGEDASLQQWGIYLASSLAVGLALWALAVWRYKQEKLAISA